MTKKEEYGLIIKIVERAEDLGIMQERVSLPKLTLLMDIENVHNDKPLNLEGLLNADNFNFAHDICGIQNNINRITKRIDNYFLPRFTR